MVWAITECGLGIISACLPTLGHFLRGWSIKIDLKALGSVFQIRYAGQKSGEPTNPNSSAVRLADLRRGPTNPANSYSSIATAQGSVRGSNLTHPNGAIFVSKSWDKSAIMV